MMTDSLEQNSVLGQDRDTKASDYGFDDKFQTLDKGRRKFTIVEYWGEYDLHEDGEQVPIVAYWQYGEERFTRY